MESTSSAYTRVSIPVRPAASSCLGFLHRSLNLSENSSLISLNLGWQSPGPRASTLGGRKKVLDIARMHELRRKGRSLAKNNLSARLFGEDWALGALEGGKKGPKAGFCPALRGSWELEHI